jgi:hypothetical protein
MTRMPSRPVTGIAIAEADAGWLTEINAFASPHSVGTYIGHVRNTSTDH